MSFPSILKPISLKESRGGWLRWHTLLFLFFWKAPPPHTCFPLGELTSSEGWVQISLWKACPLQLYLGIVGQELTFCKYLEQLFLDSWDLYLPQISQVNSVCVVICSPPKCLDEMGWLWMDNYALCTFKGLYQAMKLFFCLLLVGKI